MPDSDIPDFATRDPDMPDDALGLGLDLPPATKPVVAAAAQPAAATGGAAYRVLARKYRPQTFAELIGQDAMVQTLGNAIKRDRLAHAFLMTGVRGVGKTSTARLIAKALNCIGADGQGGPTIDPCGSCEPCVAIAEGRHIDVIEMDAASHTGVDDVREIIEAVRYSAVSARYKIYIIDEVHMLSKNAFNALLKTLEEPPGHVKFLFATTEVNKVPITVLSRCQRFDLKRIPTEMLSAHFAEIAAKEAVAAEVEALTLIAQAAEGSVRDGLSILDQAIAHADMEGDGQVTAAQVRDMLGLSDRGAIRRLFGLILIGDAQAMLAEAKNQYVLGVEPLAMFAGLLSEVHRLTLAKVGAPRDGALDAEAAAVVEDHADRLSFPVLHRLWQLLLKGQEEVARASVPLDAADMALLRVVHAATLPDPGELAKMIGEGAFTAAPAPSAATTPAAHNSSPTANVQTLMPATFHALLERLARDGFVSLEMTLRDVMRIVDYAPPHLAYQLAGPVAPNFVSELRDALAKVTGTRWDVEERAGDAQPSLLEQEQAAAEADKRIILESPLVKAAFAAFPEAELLDSDENDMKWSRSA
ncbi:DNA polymerase III subunit gamma/tau [Sphingorhabdus sp.]|uniref:DNA polymerase III subunit gamma/tau n=1 Tax=Sphingorhabdus sp. TaxID=1902408 RepID=UPI0037C6C0DE